MDALLFPLLLLLSAQPSSLARDNVRGLCRWTIIFFTVHDAVVAGLCGAQRFR
jgi:hypothetical protein